MFWRYLTYFCVLITVAGCSVAPILADHDKDGNLDILDMCPIHITGTSISDVVGCPTEIDIEAGLTFDNDLHRNWYRRFWTGQCDGVRAFCVNGVGWTESVDTLTQGLPPMEAGIMRNRLWAIGRAVGHNWAKENRLSEIETGDLRRWGQELENADNLESTLTVIETEICERLGADAIEPPYSCSS